MAVVINQSQRGMFSTGSWLVPFCHVFSLARSGLEQIIELGLSRTSKGSCFCC